MKYKVIILLFILFSVLYARADADNITFCYHRFNYSLDQVYSIPPELFEWQVNYIRGKKIKIVTLDECMKACLQKGRKKKSALITIDDGWKDFNYIIPLIKREKIPVTLFLYPDVIRYRDFLSKEELNSIKKIKRVDFGCHSYSHRLLFDLDDHSLKKEVSESKKILENILGRKIHAFAYPHGRADEKTRNLVKKNYKLAFRINPALNNNQVDRYNLNRFTIFKNTTFGEFMDAIDLVSGENQKKGYSLLTLGSEIDQEYKVQYKKIRLYKYPEEHKANTILIIPGSSLGAGWMHKAVNRFNKEDLECYLAVSRNNDVPFYRPDKVLGVIKNWGLKEFMDDLQDIFDLMAQKKKRVILITWGDGFDMLMSILSGPGDYQDLVKGVIAINPSVLEDGLGFHDFKTNVDYYDALLKEGIYSTVKSSTFLKIKTLFDIMILKPDSPSPFAQLLGYGSLSNRDLLNRVLEDEDHPSLSINFKSKEYSMDDFKAAFIQPVPLFNMVVPTALLRDINSLWSTVFRNEDYGIIDHEKINLPVVYLFSSGYSDNIARTKETFKSMKTLCEHNFGDMSTIEIMLSERAIDLIMNAANRFMAE